MARKKREDHSGNWMDTYGDMVTLLLCFFVLLYAISAVDQTKWENLVMSLNPQVTEANQTIPFTPPTTPTNEAEVEKVSIFENLYDKIKTEIEEKELQESIEVKKGDGYTFISFKDNIFFDGNSYVLKDDGKVVLDGFAEVIAPYADQIKLLEVLGHTADIPDIQTTANDRFLSSNRATAVLVFLQEKSGMDPAKMVSMGYGRYWPIADNDTSEGRAKNRRVEILITKEGTPDRSIGDFYEEMDNEQQ